MAKCAKRTQFGPSGQPVALVGGRARRGTTAPNKPNFLRSKKKSKDLAGNELWYIAPAIGFGKTKPNLGAMGYLGGGAPGRGQSYKQTQFIDFGLRIAD